MSIFPIHRPSGEVLSTSLVEGFTPLLAPFKTCFVWQSAALRVFRGLMEWVEAFPTYCTEIRISLFNVLSAFFLFCMHWRSSMYSVV